MFVTSAAVSYVPVHHEVSTRLQHSEIFEEYFKRITDEGECQFSSFDACPRIQKNQTRRISAPVHRVPVSCDVKVTNRQRRSQSMRYSGHGAREKYRGIMKPFNSAPENRSSYKTRDQKTWRTAVSKLKLQNYEEEEEEDGLSTNDPVERKLQLVKLMQGMDCTVVRSFSTSPRGLIHRGDSFRRKQTETVKVVDKEQLLASIQLSQEEMQCENLSTTQTAPIDPPRMSNHGRSRIHKVLVMGDHGVGKTSLLQQFITSEYTGTADPVFDNELEKTVSVQVDDVETTLTFVDLPRETQKDWKQHSDVDAFIVCYSVTDRCSFNFAVELLDELKSRQGSHSAVIIVANKSDLVRTRKVTFEEGKSVCQKCGCKFIEVSAAFNHAVVELLVGVVHQIRLNPKRQRAKSVPNTGLNSSNEALLSFKSLSFGCFRGARIFIAEFLFGSKKTKSRSCDNLWSL